jgi:hypothetical protein
MRLPYADRAVVDIAKLREYVLNEAHPRGRHKARVFASALGLGADEAAWLRIRILEAVLQSDAVPGLHDRYGQRFMVEFSVSTAVGQALVRSLWIIRAGEELPRLTSCYVA